MLASDLLINNSYEELLLLSDILNISKHELRFHANKISITKDQAELFHQYQQRIMNSEPVSKIINKRDFWNDTFFINSDVLDPRPDTELIIEVVMKNIDIHKNINILDLGTGSGCIILSLLREYKNAHGVGIDISDKAIAVATKNQQLLGIKNVNFQNASWNDFETETRFDVIVSNPPYIKTCDIDGLDENVKKHDPILALDGGDSGLVCYEQITPLSKKFLKNNGVLVFEVGFNQSEDVSSIMKSHNFHNISIYKDLSGTNRVISGMFLQD